METRLLSSLVVVASLLLLSGFVRAQDVQVLEFALQLSGQCNMNTNSCTVAGGSQQITTTFVGSNETVDFTIKKAGGAAAVLNFQLSTSDRANMSFYTGMDQGLQLLPLQGTAAFVPTETQGSYILCGTYMVLGGYGVFQDAYGTVMYSHLFNVLNGTVTSFLYGRPFVLHFDKKAQDLAQALSRPLR